MTDDAFDPKVRRRNQLKLLAIFAIVALPLVAAWLIHWTGLGMPSGTTNKGELLASGLDLQELPLRDGFGQPWELPEQTLQWRLVVPVLEDCGEGCKELLYITRQVHKRLADKAERLERLYITAKPLSAPFRAWLEEEHPRLQILFTEPEPLRQWLQADPISAPLLQQPGYLLVAPRGPVVLHYDAGHEGGELLKDIKHLLRYSYEGQ